MALVEHIDAPVSLLGKPPGELTLRVCRGGRAQQIVQLASQKCSVGSGADCTLRLHDAGIQPHHFVILRGKRHTIVRRLAGEALLNNRPFEDAELVSGDWLTLGELQVQVLTPNAPHAGRKAGVAWDEPEVNQPALRPKEAAELVALRARVELANGQGRERVRRLVVRLRKLQRRFTDLEFRRQQQATETRELEERLEAWNAERIQLDERRAEFERDEQTFLDSRTTWFADSSEREQQLTAREMTLASQIEQLRRDAEILATDRAALIARHDQHHIDHQLRMAALDEREQAIAGQAIELEDVSQQHVQATLHWQSDRREAEARLAQQEAALAARLREVESERTALDARERQLQATADALQAAERQLDEQRTRWKVESSAEQARLDVAAREMNEKLTALEVRWREAADLTRELTARQAAVNVDEQQLRAAQTAWESERTAGESDTQQQLRQLADQQATLERERDETEQRSAEIDRTRDSLKQEAAELESLRAVFATEQAQWEAERTATLARLALRTEEVDRLSQELDERVRQSAVVPQVGVEKQIAEQQAAEAAHTTALTELTARTAEFDRDRKAFELAQAAWETQRAKIEQAAAEKPQQSDQDAAESAARACELAESQQALAAKAKQLEESQVSWHAEQAREQERLQAAQGELAAEQSHLEEARAELTACATELETARQAFEHEQAARQAENQAAIVHPQVAVDQAAADALQNELDAARRSLESLEADRSSLESDRQTLAAERQQLADERRTSHEQLAALHGRLEQLQAEREAERDRHEQLVKQLEQRQADLTAHQQEGENQLAAGAAEHDRREAELTAGLDATAAQQATFVAEQQQARDELDALAAQHAEQTAEIERLQRELTEERQAFRDRREQIEQKLHERTEDLETRWAELQTRQTEFDAWLESQEAELAQRREAMASDTDQPDDARHTADEPPAYEPAAIEEPRAEEPRAEEPRNPSSARNTQLSSLALLTKMGLAVPDDETDHAPPPEVPAAHPRAAKAPPAAAPSSEATEEEDYDDFMRTQMARLLGQSSSRTAAATAQRSPSAPQAQPASPAPEVAPVAAAPAEPKRPERSLAPRALPPELSADLSAMREVANANARSAIKTHMHRTVSKQRVKRMWACLVMLLVCVVLIWRHFQGLPWMLEAAAVVGLLTVLMGARQWHAMFKFRKVEAEIDSQHTPSSPVPAPRAEQDRSIPFTELANAELQPTDTDEPSSEESTAS